MTNFGLIIILCLFFMFFGGAYGVEKGRVQVHSGEFACQTLPDKTTHCWKVKK